MNTLLKNKLETLTPRSAWGKGVKEQALEMVEQAQVTLTRDNALVELLNGADNWSEYSYNGNTLVYDADIAERYSTPSELKRNDFGNKTPNAHEEWLDLQARALAQAYAMIRRNI